MTPRGPRPAGEDTRTAILLAAREHFATKGYDGTSLRGIARSAGVDPALVHHYFNGKGALFAESIANLPVDPAILVAALLHGDPDEMGANIVRTFLGVWDRPEHRERFVALLNWMTSNPAGAASFREFITRTVFGAVVGTIDAPDAHLRAGLVGSHLIGLAVMRYVVRLGPVAEATVEELATIVGPVLQGYLHPTTP